jgi:hypothetical protein
MANIEVDVKHILDQGMVRYGNSDLPSMLKRVQKALEEEAPEDWRFTESPSARFFVVDYETKVKILGMSYRDFGRRMVNEIQDSIHRNCAENLTPRIKEFVSQYLRGLSQPDVKIIHHLRTAYPKTKGEIGEEKSIVRSIKDQLSHVIPIQEKKFSTRPNAIIMGNGELWVRQHLIWMDMTNPNKEYFLFEQLTTKGINKSQRKIFSYTVNGDVKEITIPGCPTSEPECFPQIKKESFMPESFKTVTYWTLPTYLDRRLMDLEFREREPEQADEGPLSRDELVELHFLRKIVQEARSKFKIIK